MGQSQGDPGRGVRVGESWMRMGCWAPSLLTPVGGQVRNIKRCGKYKVPICAQQIMYFLSKFKTLKGITFSQKHDRVILLVAGYLPEMSEVPP